MDDHAEYVGDIRELKGKRALVRPDATYDLNISERTLLAQFDDPNLVHLHTRVALGFN